MHFVANLIVSGVNKRAEHDGGAGFVIQRADRSIMAEG
jgi:hypothetical protein